MTLTDIRNSIVEHVAEVGKQIDGEYHQALTAFLDFVERKDVKLKDAVALLAANGYTVTPPAPAVPAPAAAPAATTAAPTTAAPAAPV